jgi:hypothetical protein
MAEFEDLEAGRLGRRGDGSEGGGGDATACAEVMRAAWLAAKAVQEPQNKAKAWARMWMTSKRSRISLLPTMPPAPGRATARRSIRPMPSMRLISPRGRPVPLRVTVAAGGAVNAVTLLSQERMGKLTRAAPGWASRANSASLEPEDGGWHADHLRLQAGDRERGRFPQRRGVDAVQGQPPCSLAILSPGQGCTGHARALHRVRQRIGVVRAAGARKGPPNRPSREMRPSGCWADGKMPVACLKVWPKGSQPGKDG